MGFRQEVKNVEKEKNQNSTKRKIAPSVESIRDPLYADNGYGNRLN